MKSSLNLKSLGLVLAGQPIGVLVVLTAEFEEATQRAQMETDPAWGDRQGRIFAEVGAQPSIGQEEVEVGRVRKTLSEVLAEAKPSFATSGAVKTGP